MYRYSYALPLTLISMLATLKDSNKSSRYIDNQFQYLIHISKIRSDSHRIIKVLIVKVECEGPIGLGRDSFYFYFCRCLKCYGPLYKHKLIAKFLDTNFLHTEKKNKYLP